MPFSTRFEMASVSFTSSTSAVTGRKLSSTSSTCCFCAIGRRRFKISSSSSLILSTAIFRLSAALSIFTSESRSVIILFSRSISVVISCMNSLYSSNGAFSCMFKESASTFIDVKGVFNSCETFETNSCLESSSTFMRSNSSFVRSQINSVSEYE